MAKSFADMLADNRYDDALFDSKLAHTCVFCAKETTNGSLVESCPKRRNGYRHVWREGSAMSMWTMKFCKIQAGEEFRDQYEDLYEKVDESTGSFKRGASAIAHGTLVTFKPDQEVELVN